MEPSQTKFFLTVPETWEAMLAACKEAKETIDLEQYIFNDDKIGHQFAEVLRERARNGVRIRVLCDAVGSWGLYTSPLPTLMENDGIEIRFFNIISPWRIHNALAFFFRDHRKILIIDGKVGFTGSSGLRDDMPEWRDTNVQVGNSIVSEMLFAFNEMWARAAEKRIINRIRKARDYAPGFEFITNAPYVRKRFLYYKIIEAIRAAKKHIYITTPYFIPDRRLGRVLRLAEKRGVDVRVLVPAKDIEPFVGLAARSHFEPMLKNGIRFFLYEKSFLHAKTIVIDDEWSTVGSFNMDSLSFIYNHEANIVSSEPSFVAALKEHFLTDLTHAREISYIEWLGRPLLQKIKEILIIPLRRFL